MNRTKADRLAVLTSASMQFIECAGTLASIVRREIEADSHEEQVAVLEVVMASMRALVEINTLYGVTIDPLIDPSVSTAPRLEQWDGQRVYPGLIESPVLEPTDYNPSGTYGQIKTEEGGETCIKGDWLVFDQHGMVRDVIPAKRVQE